jgi:ABC-type Fe3+-hydroxamate transport system substrate-binding protein
VEIAGKTVFKPEVAAELIANMNDGLRTIREKANFADDKQADEVLNVYREGIASLRKRLEKQ